MAFVSCCDADLCCHKEELCVGYRILVIGEVENEFQKPTFAIWDGQGNTDFRHVDSCHAGLSKLQVSASNLGMKLDFGVIACPVNMY